MNIITRQIQLLEKRENCVGPQAEIPTLSATVYYYSFSMSTLAKNIENQKDFFSYIITMVLIQKCIHTYKLSWDASGDPLNVWQQISV